MAHRNVQGHVGTRGVVGFGSLLVIAALVAAGCGSSASNVFSGAGDAVRGQPAEVPAATAGPAAPGLGGELGSVNTGTGGATSPDGSEAGPAGVPDVSGPLIVRTGQLDLQVADIDAAIRAAESAVTTVGGYVAGSQRSGDADKAYASVLFRIPAARWTEALDALRAIGSKVLGEQTSSQEVTTQVVDLGARLTNLRTTESALQAIMGKATKIPDVLAVQEQLTGVRQQIEELTAQKLNLENQAALATLTVNFTPPPPVAFTEVREGWDPARELDQAAAALVGLGQGLAGAGIWLLVVWLPILVIVGLLALVVLLVVRRVRRPGTRRTATPPAPPAAEA